VPTGEKRQKQFAIFDWITQPNRTQEGSRAGFLFVRSLSSLRSEFLFDRDDRAGLRAYALARVRDEHSKLELQRLHELSRERSRDYFEMEVIGPINRIAEFVSSSAIRAIVGQRKHVIDLARAMDEGHVILANLQGGDRAHDTHAELLGRLLTRFLFFHAKRRARWERPFFVYLDECQRYLSGELDNILAEVRKYGVGTVLAHQWLRQIGEADDSTRAAILNAPNTKVVFRVTNHAEAEELALATIPLEFERPKHVLDKPTAVGVRVVSMRGTTTSEHAATSESEMEATGETIAESVAFASMAGMGSGESSGQVMMPDGGWFPAANIVSESVGMNAAQHSGSAESSSSMSATTTVRGSSRGKMKGGTESESVHDAFEPIYETLPTAVYSKEEELYRASQLLMSLKGGQCIAAFIGRDGRMTRPVMVPPVTVPRISDREFLALRAEVLEESAAAVPIGEALDTDRSQPSVRGGAEAGIAERS
jgi:hypothetical protein